MQEFIEKIKELAFSTPQRTIGFLGIVAILLALPLTLSLVGQQTNLRQKAAEQLACNEKTTSAQVYLVEEIVTEKNCNYDTTGLNPTCTTSQPVTNYPNIPDPNNPDPNNPTIYRKQTPKVYERADAFCTNLAETKDYCRKVCDSTDTNRISTSYCTVTTNCNPNGNCSTPRKECDTTAENPKTIKYNCHMVCNFPAVQNNDSVNPPQTKTSATGSITKICKGPGIATNLLEATWNAGSGNDCTVEIIANQSAIFLSHTCSDTWRPGDGKLPNGDTIPDSGVYSLRVAKAGQEAVIFGPTTPPSCSAGGTGTGNTGGGTTGSNSNGSIKNFQKVCADGSAQRPKNVLVASWEIADASLVNNTDCSVEIVAGTQAQFLSNKCKGTWQDDITPFNEAITDKGWYGIIMKRNGDKLGEVNVKNECSGTGGATGGTTTTDQPLQGSMGQAPAPSGSCPLIVPPARGIQPEDQRVPVGDACISTSNPGDLSEITNCDTETNTINYYNKWWCHPKKIEQPSDANAPRDSTARKNHQENQSKVTLACRWNDAAPDSPYIVNFRGRLRDLMKYSDHNNANGSKHWTRGKYNPNLSRQQRIDAWNTMMKTAYSKKSSFGWKDYDGDLSYAAAIIFNKSWGQVAADFNCPGATTGSGTSQPNYSNFDIARGTNSDGKPEVLRGWACDPNNPNYDVVVYLYDGPRNSGGASIGTAVANVNRISNPDPDYVRQWGSEQARIDGENQLITQTCGRSSSRNAIGWRFDIPSDSFLRDGQTHRLYAYATDSSGRISDTNMTYFYYQSDPVTPEPASDPKYKAHGPAYTIRLNAVNEPEPSPTVTLPPGATGVNVAVTLPVINNGNPRLGNINNPKHPNRNLTLFIYNVNDQGQLIKQKSGTVTYDPSSSSFKGAFDLGSDFATGNYIVKVKLDNTLIRQLRNPDSIRITNGQVTTLQTIELVPGNMNDDNILDASDYNALFACINNTSSCSDQERVMADVNDDGVVDYKDNGIFIRSFQKRFGD